MSGSKDDDFVEVEVSSPTYQALLRACCEELEIGISDVLKLRKLPNVWVRKDRDVQRIRPGQELEVVLRTEISGSIPVCSGAAAPLTSVLTVNPFTCANTIPIFSLQAPTAVRHGETAHSNLIMTETDLPPSSHVNGLS